MNEATAFSNTLANFTAIYLIHSTVLLSSCWLVLRVTRTTSHSLIERMWKWAAVLGLLTTLIHVTCGGGWLDSVAMRYRSPATIAAPSGMTGVVNGGAKGAVYTAATPLDTAVQLPRDNDGLADAERHAVIDSHRNHNEVVVVTSGHGIAATAATDAQEWHDDQDDVASAALPDRVIAESFLLEPTDSLRRESVLAETQVSTGTSGFSQFEMQSFLPWIAAVFSGLLVSCVVIGSALLVLHSLRLRFRFASSRPLQDGPAHLALSRFLKRNRIRRRIRLLTSSVHHEPVAFGLFVWTIVLPQHTETRLGKEELRALLAHEVAHLVRGDIWWLWIGRLICACLAFQPLNMLARRQWQCAGEFLCDDWAVQRGIRSLSLARCLTQIAEWRVGRQACHVGLAAGGTKATLVGRVERLVATDKPNDVWATTRGRRWLTAGACVIAIALVGLTPRFALPFASSSRSIRTASAEVQSGNDAAELQAEWHFVNEELLQLESDLDQAVRLLRSADSQTDVKRSNVGEPDVNGFELNGPNANESDLEKQIDKLKRKFAALRAPSRTHHIVN